MTGLNEIKLTYEDKFFDLITKAHDLHLKHHPKHTIQKAKLLSIKTGACPEDCGYCSQSGHHNTHVEKEKLLDTPQVVEKAKLAKKQGATRFCMGAAYRSPPPKAMPQIIEMVEEVKKLGLETCMTLGMLSKEQASQLKEAGLDYYNHNIDTSAEYYPKVITTRTFEDRLDTIKNIQQVGIHVCCGGILGLGETRQDRQSFLHTLANLNPQPKSVPINQLIAVKGTPLEHQKPIDSIELIRTIATARIIMPTSVIRLTAGRTEMSDELQALAYYVGANSIFIGDTLLTEPNPEQSIDDVLLKKINLKSEVCEMM